MKLPAPATLRQTFQLFSLYRSDQGVSSIAGQLDWSGVTPAQIYHAVLGRLPESKVMAIAKGDYSAHQHFIDSIESREFREAIIENVVTAYPEKRRLIFVHIPKCAGTDLEINLSERFPTLSREIITRTFVEADRFFADVADVVFHVLLSDSIFLTGHTTLKWYLDNGIYRFGDKIFSVVRDPQDLILSLVNYVVMTIRSDPEILRADTARWLADLGEVSIAPDMSYTEGIALARRVLRSTNIVQSNYLCSFLGEGTAESTIDILARSDIEICTIKRYKAWKRQVWGMLEESHHNRSNPILTRENISHEDLQYIKSLISEDEKFYRWITNLMDRSNSSSIRGLELARHESLLSLE